MRSFFVPVVLASLAALAGCAAPDATSSSYRGGDYADAGTAPSPGAGQAIPGTTSGTTAENDWVETAKQATSTFGADVDTGSYTLMRRDLSAGILPSSASVRPEEYINYFGYDYAAPTDGKPFSVLVDGAPSKFGTGLHLVRVALQGAPIDESQRKQANLVFLVDVSGSMDAENKLPLVKETLRRLIGKLRPTDHLSIVTYAGYESVLLAPTAVVDKQKILAAIDGLSANGSTNGEGGIRTAYELAEKTRHAEGSAVNRVILCTDGDFNVGLTGPDLVALVEKERDSGVTLTTLGFGNGGYNDAEMESLADHGNGNYAFIDSAAEIDRMIDKRFVATLQVIAKDAKIQIDFAPESVSKYRLVGYENRVLLQQDFADDKKDSGDLGAGHSVTAFYEVQLTEAGRQTTSELAAVHLRYKQPDGITSDLLEKSLLGSALASSFDAAPTSLRFAAATAEFAEILRRSKHSEGARFDDVISILGGSAGADADKQQLIELVKTAKVSWR